MNEKEVVRVQVSALLRADVAVSRIVELTGADIKTINGLRKELQDEEKQNLLEKETNKKKKEEQNREISVNNVSSTKKSPLEHPFGKKSLSKSMKLRRVDCGHRLMKELKRGKRTIFFSAEKTFCKKPFNCSYRVLLFDDETIDDLPPHLRYYTPQHRQDFVNVLTVVASTGERMPPVMIEEMFKVDSYIEALEKHVKPWIMSVVGEDRDYVFQQGSGPVQKSPKVQKWLGENLNFWNKEMWPPCSNDINPLVFSILGIHEKHMGGRKTYASVKELKEDILRAWDEIDDETVRKACRLFRGKVDTMIKKQGSNSSKD